MKLRLSTLCVFGAALALSGCKDLLKLGKGNDAGADGSTTSGIGADGDASTTAAAAGLASGAAATAGAADAGSATAAAAASFAAFSGQTSAKTSFHIAIERVDQTVRAVVDTGSPIVLAGKMSDATHFSLRATKTAKGEKPATLTGELTGSTLKASFTDQGKSQTLASGGGGAVPASFDEEYVGNIGKQFVRVKLARRAGSLSGIYRYAASASDLKLDGIVHDDGRFELTEKAGGKETGKLKGAFASKGSLLGQWQSPDGSRSAPITLEKGSGYPETRAYDNGITLFPQEKIVTGNRCKVDEVFPQIRGVTDKAGAKEINDYLRGESGKAKTCEGPDDPTMADFESSEGYTLETKKGRFIGVNRSGYSYAGGAHGGGGSVCDVVDTKTAKHFKLVSLVTDAGRKKLGELVTAALAKQNNVTKLTDAGFNEDQVTISKTTDLCLGDAYVEVQFDAYEIGPYMLGPQSARFPKAQVKDLFEKGEVTDAIFDAK